MMPYFPLQWTVLTLPFQEWSFQCSQKAIINNAKVTEDNTDRHSSINYWFYGITISYCWGYFLCVLSCLLCVQFPISKTNIIIIQE